MWNRECIRRRSALIYIVDSLSITYRKLLRRNFLAARTEYRPVSADLKSRDHTSLSGLCKIRVSLVVWRTRVSCILQITSVPIKMVHLEQMIQIGPAHLTLCYGSNINWPPKRSTRVSSHSPISLGISPLHLSERLYSLAVDCNQCHDHLILNESSRTCNM
jgi:hypothetical protein